jgi:muramoyltetrapeptide carboxypeptidase
MADMNGSVGVWKGRSNQVTLTHRRNVTSDKGKAAMLRPKPLKKGDLFGLTATARFLEEERLQIAEKRLTAAGFQTVRTKYCDKPFHQFGGDDEQRAADLQSLLENKEVRAIFSVRGGYGTVRILDKLDFSHFDKDHKWICGYSDVTALHSRMQALGFQSLHCSMPVNFGDLSEEAFLETLHILHGNRNQINWENEESKNIEAKGILRGGNLSVLYSLLGSTDFPKLDGSILFIEEIDEYIYHIDRMLQALRRANVFRGLKAVVVGGLTDMNDHQIPFGWSTEELIKQCFQSLGIPVVFGFPAGHINYNMPLIFGDEVELKCDGLQCQLSYVEG